MNRRRAIVSLAFAALAGAAEAQQDMALDEIVVTSRRVSENLQDVPVSITAFSAKDLEKQVIRNARDLANFTPNLTFTSGADGRAAVPVIRGIGLIDGRGFDNPVGLFIDGIFFSGRAAQNVGMLDLERVEVIKGPQSALYGRNTFSGAINYVTRQISDEVTGLAEATLGSDALQRFNGSLSGALTDWMSARLAVGLEDDRGTYRNSGPLGVGAGIGGGDFKQAMLTLQFQPRDDLKIAVSGLWSDEFGASRPLAPQANNCGPLDPMAPANASLISRDLRTPFYFCGAGGSLEGGALSISPEAFAFQNDTKRATLSFDWELPGVTIISQTAYTTSTSFSKTDLDRTQAGEAGYGYLPRAAYVAAGSPTFNFANGMGFICSGFVPAGPCSPNPAANAPLFNQVRGASFNTFFNTQGLDQDYWSSELRFQGPRESRLRWLGGLFYFRSKNDDTTGVGIDASEAVRTLGLPLSQIQFVLLDSGGVIPGLAPRGYAVAFPPPAFPPQAAFLNGPGTAVVTYTPLVNVQESVFGSLEYDFTDKLTGTFELRYTNEEQDLDNVFDIYFGGRGRFTSSSSFTDPRFTVRYEASEDLMIYGSAARGTRSGGINALITDPAFINFDPETNNTYELGIKSALAGGRIQLNASVFQIDWKDAQFRQTAPSSTGTGTLVTATLNVGEVESRGAEISLAARLTESWRIDAAVGYSDPKFGDDTFAASLEPLCRPMLPGTATAVPQIPVNCVARSIGGISRTQPKISGLQLPRTSKVTSNVGIEYSHKVLTDAAIVARLDASYRSKQYADFINASWAPGRTIANFRLGLERENYDINLWIENLTDQDAPEQLNQAGQTNLAGSAGFTSVSILPVQRRYGITARYRFQPRQRL
ncbi:MAG: TonB-dependent receptor [Steroidobacteraceae bacterium]|jgi:iron complex outermembrane receptor protein|nr:TonB-dependent receptor [Steroidobacteraceae bacterium]